jgi:hypothetical protein
MIRQGIVRLCLIYKKIVDNFFKEIFKMILKLNLDKLGIGASLLCAIHCALLPVLFTTLPLMGIELLENEQVELGFILFSLVVGCFALYNGYKKHHRKISPLKVFVLA